MQEKIQRLMFAPVRCGQKTLNDYLRDDGSRTTITAPAGESEIYFMSLKMAVRSKHRQWAQSIG
jgi:hypothetical protein